MTSWWVYFVNLSNYVSLLGGAPSHPTRTSPERLGQVLIDRGNRMSQCHIASHQVIQPLMPTAVTACNYYSYCS
mgnify:CR=1 FL=1